MERSKRIIYIKKVSDRLLTVDCFYLKKKGEKKEKKEIVLKIVSDKKLYF